MSEARVLVVGAGDVAVWFLIRPDGHIGWRGEPGRAAGLNAYLDRVLAIGI